MRLYRWILARWAGGALVLPVLLFLVMGSGPVLAQTPPTANLVVSIVGEVEIHRAEWAVADASSRLTVGELVQSDDLVILDSGEQVVILCANSTVVRLESVPQTVGCLNDPGPVITWAGVQLVVTRRGESARFNQIPYLIAPRNTRVRSGTPTLKWAAIEGAQCYSVKLLRSGELAWEQTGLTDAVLPYPADAAPLEPGDYVVIITPFDAQGNAIRVPRDPIPNHFEIIDSSAAAEIDTRAEAIRAASESQQIPEALAAYQLALFYAEQELYTDAIDTLMTALEMDFYADNPLAALASPEDALAASPAPYLRLSELFRMVGLPVEMATGYEMALQIAQESDDAEATAVAQAQLAQLVLDREAMIDYYQAAIRFYQAVGDEATAQALQQRCRTVGTEEECGVNN